MKFRSLKKLILPTVMATLLVSVPASSDAATSYRFTYDLQNNNYLNRVVAQPYNNYYTINRNQTAGNYNNYYVVSRGDYSRPTNNDVSVERPVERPVENVQPQPAPQPVPQPQPAPQPQPQPAPNTNPGSNGGLSSNGRHSLSGAEIQMVDYVNKARQDAGLPALQIDADLAYVARVKSQDMYDNKYFSHDSPTYGSPFDMMTKFGIQYRGAAENIAKNTSVEAAQNSFMRSQGHKDNILNPIYTHIGVGIYNGHYTQMFIRK